MPPLLLFAIMSAHALVYPVVALSIWVFAHHSEFYKTTLRLRSLSWIYWGYACFAIAATYEIAEHIGDRWFYVSQISSLNLLFYSFINFGMGFIALGLKKAKWLDLALIASLVAVPALYGVNDSKSLMQMAQSITAVIFVWKWFQVMKDKRVFLYLLFSNVLAIGLGVALIVTENQIFHIFVGPANAAGLLILSLITWQTPQKYQLSMNRPGT